MEAGRSEIDWMRAEAEAELTANGKKFKEGKSLVEIEIKGDFVARKRKEFSAEFSTCINGCRMRYITWQCIHLRTIRTYDTYRTAYS